MALATFLRSHQGDRPRSAASLGAVSARLLTKISLAPMIFGLAACCGVCRSEASTRLFMWPAPLYFAGRRRGPGVPGLSTIAAAPTAFAIARWYQPEYDLIGNIITRDTEHCDL
jgi:hypothetical protein